MSINSWRGDAPAVAQVDTITIGSATAAQTFKVTRNGKTVQYVAGSGETTATIAAALQALLDASTIAEFRERSWAYPGTGADLTGTAQNPGVSSTFTVSGTGTISISTTTASSGPSDVSVLANWSTGALPAGGETVEIARGADLLYGFAALSAPVALAGINIHGSFTGAIGLPPLNENGGYVEDRTRGFPVATTVPVVIGIGEGTGPSRVVLALTTAAAVTVLKTQGRTGDQSVPVVCISGAGSGTLTVAGGDVGLAADDPSLSITLTSATVGPGATLVNGAGGTVTTLTENDGAVVNYGTVGTLNGNGGTFDHYGTISTAVVADPSNFVFRWRCGGTIPTVTFKGQGAGRSAPILDCTLDPRVKTMTNHTFTGGAVLEDPDKTTVWSNAGAWDAASLAASDLGYRFTLSRT